MSGGNICSIATCNSNSKKQDPDGKKIMFFSFPKDPIILKEWARKCGRTDNWTPQNKRICSKHFLLADYDDELRARLMNYQPMHLKKDAVPTLFLQLSENKESVVSKRGKRIEKRMIQKERKKLVEGLLQLETEKLKKVPRNISMDILEVASTSKETDHDIWEKEMSLLRKENEQLKKKIVDYENNETILKQRISNLEVEIQKYEYDKTLNIEEKIKIALQDVLSSNQVDIALKKKSKARWTQDELSKAFTLRYFSKKSYEYLKQTLHYPLPGISTLEQWAANNNKEMEF